MRRRWERACAHRRAVSVACRSPLDCPPALAASEDKSMDTEEILIDLDGLGSVDPLTGAPLEVDVGKGGGENHARKNAGGSTVERVTKVRRELH